MKKIKSFREAIGWLSLGAVIFSGSFSGYWLTWGQEKYRIPKALLKRLIEKDSVQRTDGGTSHYGARYVGRSKIL